MTKVTFVSVMLAIGVMAGSVTAADEELFAACAPMALSVTDLDPEGTQATGLTQEAIVNAAEARLRSARLLVPFTKQLENPQTWDWPQILSVPVSIVGPRSLRRRTI